MNQEDAKIPNVDGRWQSIEIFLFSNGQQYSPPRKYLLRVDDLILWDATLNHLAQSHYGLQSPLIDLYTTNGQLVGGPLDLIDGQAYVAVVPPDTFVDAGYQKYLMKASKSWEKRQARKFPPECVLGEPCCLCPERQRSCCDPQACCLCPEREDAESQKQLLPASEHMDLGPPSGHFMSFAPAKSVAEDDNELVSGKTACATCGHVIRPGEIEFSPVQGSAKSDGYKAIHDGNVVSPCEYEARQGENSTRLYEYRPKLSEVTARLAEYGTGPREYETGSSLTGAKPAEYRVRLGENVARPAEYGITKQGEYKTRPTVNGTRPGEFGVRPGEYETRPGEYGAKPDEYESRPSVNGATPSDFGTRPGDYGARLGKYKTRTIVTGPRPSEYETRPSVNGAKPYEYGAGPGEYEIRSTTNGVKPGEYGARPLEYNTRPSVNEAKLREFGAIPGEYETRPSVNQAKQAECGIKPDENETIPSVNAAKLGEYETRLSLNVAKPDEYESRPSLKGTKAGEYETRPSLNEAKPTEYETRPSLHEAKTGEYETKPSLNGAKPGEYETRPSLKGAKPSEYETKPNINEAKPTENESRPSLHETKPGEYETKPSLNGAKPGEYETRPSINQAKPGEYENRPNVNGAKLGEIGARPADYATQSSEQENQPDENGPSSVKKGAWSGENGDRTASHKTRPGHSGYKSSKIEPIIKAYEIVLHKKEKSLDESEDTPDKDTAEKDPSIKSEFPRQGSTLDPTGKNGLEQKAEYRTRQDDQREKDIETRSSRNESKGGERRLSSAEKNTELNDTVSGLVESRVRKNENARNLSRRSGAEIEQRSRTGEPTTGFEHGGKDSAQKGRETRPASRVGGQGASENGPRLSAQTNKQSDNLARLGGRESRVGDHEARAGDLGLGTSGHDAGLDNPVSEPGAGAATSGSRASPKDRMSSRIKNNLVLPKIGTPGTRINKTLVRIDDADIENKEDNPDARQSRVGSTKAAGILHISEAQHHARRNKLSAGRPTIEKKRLSIEPNSTSLRKPTQNSNIVRKTENKQPVKTNKENILKKINEKSSAIPVPASNDSGKSKTQRITPSVRPPTTISTTELITSTTTKALPENAMRLDSVKHVVDTIENSPAETQTELIYIEKSMANVSVNEGVQTDTEAVEQHENEVSASNKENTNSCTCVLSKQLNRRVDPDENDENTLSMFNRGGVVNIKLNIQVRNIVKPVYSCQKDCERSQSLTNITRSEKESQISIDNDMVVNRTSLQSLFNKPNFQGFGFEGSPKVMVVQCAGCGRLNNPPRCDPSPCCDNNKKYFVLLENSVLEDMADGCNFTLPRRPCDQRQSRKQSSGIPITQAFSETTLDTITTVTVSGVPLQRREMGKCVTNTSCQTEEPQSESVIAKRKVSITEDSVTKGDLQKKSSSSVCVTTQPDNLVRKQSCRKMCSQKCESEDSQVCSDVCRVVCSPTTEKVEALCSSVRSPSCDIVEAVCLQVSPPTCEVEQSKGCQQASPQVQSQGCMPASPTYTSFCLMLPPPCMQAQTQVCPCQGPQVCNAETQTRWASILLQARLHSDGRYSFHLPPLYLLKNNNSYWQ